jgi:hypothetical protein
VGKDLPTRFVLGNTLNRETSLLLCSGFFTTSKPNRLPTWVGAHLLHCDFRTLFTEFSGSWPSTFLPPGTGWTMVIGMKKPFAKKGDRFTVLWVSLAFRVGPKCVCDVAPRLDSRRTTHYK